MNKDLPVRDGEGAPSITKALRLDLIIAVCALLISCLATGASWWQAHILVAQTNVLEEQLGAQVWPYLSITESIDGNTVKISLENDGLGPAVLRSASAAVDGVSRRNFIDILHAVLGPNLVARAPHHEKISLALSGAQPGSVLRPGDTVPAFVLTSKSYARPFLLAYRRLDFRTCYCAIIPGKCWQSDSLVTRDPTPVSTCPEIRTDLLHASAVDELLGPKF